MISKFGFRSGKGSSNWKELSHLITENYKFMQLVNLQIIVMGQAHTSYKMRTSTHRVDCYPADILLSEIENKFITSAKLGAMVFSAKSKVF